MYIYNSNIDMCICLQFLVYIHITNLFHQIVHVDRLFFNPQIEV